MNDDQYFLANAYLDGELADDERRIAEADPAVMAEVEILRDLQAELRAVDAPTAAARDSAIGAAMAEFTAGDAVATASASVVPFRPRPAYSRYLGIAAAVVAVGVLGVVIVNGGSGGDNDASMAEPAALDVADAADDGGAESAADRDVIESVSPTDLENATAAVAADEAGAEEATGDAADQMAESEMADTATADDESAEMSADEGDSEATTPAADTDTFRDVDVAYDTAARVTLERPDIDVDEPITNDAELGAYGSYLLELQNQRALPPTPNTDCDPSYNILTVATAIINDVETDVYIAVQEDDERVIGMDKRNCEELVDGPLFPPNNR